MIAYLSRLYHEAKTKLTTYWVLLTVGVAELPNAISSDNLNALRSVVPDSTHKHIVAGLAVVTIWTRVRRQIKKTSPSTPPAPPP